MTDLLQVSVANSLIPDLNQFGTRASKGSPLHLLSNPAQLKSAPVYSTKLPVSSLR